jgi:1,4-alpha-glucan branching enzyme
MSEGFAYQGEVSAHAGGRPRGAPSRHLPSTAFVICLQNHDQIGNRAMGERLLTLAPPEAVRAAMALLLLTPQIPKLFMGEEWGETRPFLYFTDHNEELGQKIREGRRREFARFAAFADPQQRGRIPDPNAPETFQASRITPQDNEWTMLCEACLQTRHAHIVNRIPGCKSLGASALSGAAIRAAWRMNDGTILTLAANFAAEPVALEGPQHNCLFTTGTADQPPGMLPAFSTTAWLHLP